MKKKLDVSTPKFIPQPSTIQKIMMEKFQSKKLEDEFGWTGEWSLSVKDVLDIIIDLQNTEIKK